MPESMDKPLHKRAHREYFWFALMLLAVLVAAATREAGISGSQIRTSADHNLSAASP
jgi:hypothetical protein